MRGVYLLLLMVGRDLKIRVGSLGVVRFKRGYYVYVGSGQRYLEKRIQRHKKKIKKVKWHIDYLTTNSGVRVMEAAVYNLPKKYECIFADMLRSMGFKSVKGFGSTDCKCISHLYQIDVDFDRIVDEISDKVRVKPLRLDP
ncbi:MAG: GIY-YIG nuclease family protein [Thaumarchaeota archaeon]|nr:GIY-YIG nuclease family protein [Nitrososphaerota archaeon]